MSKSKRLNLREFQQGVIDRLQAKDRTDDQATTLGVEIAGQNWLVDMSDVSEVLPPPPLTPVPLTKPWFLGVANVRGVLYSVADMAAYQQKGTASGAAANRVLLVAERHAFNAALLVDRVLGLRNARAWTQSEVNGQIQYHDVQGNSWRKQDIVGLLVHPDILQIGI